MLKLKLEEIADDTQRTIQPQLIQSSQRTGYFLVTLDEKQIVHFLLYRGNLGRANSYRGIPLPDVHHYENRSQFCIHTYLAIDDRAIPSRQGTFRRKQDGTSVYENECHHGTLIIPANATESRLIHRDYAIEPGDQFLLGFPRSAHRFRATIMNS